MAALTLAIPSKGRLQEQVGEYFADAGAALKQSAGARGYRATVVAGEVTYRDGEPTGALPGRLVRGGRDTAHTPLAS